MRTLQLTLACTFLFTHAAFAQSYKCQGADGRIEYSDRPCDTSKNALSQPGKASGAPSSSAPAVAMDKLTALFSEYEQRLCERERLATEIDMAHRSNAIATNEAVWKPRQERLSFLNDTLVEFQGKAVKFTQPGGPDGEGSKAMRKFQSKLKDCGKLDKPAGK